MKQIYLLLGGLLIFGGVISQDLPEKYRAYLDLHSQGPELTRRDSILLMDIPEISIPATLRHKTLPPVVDNSLLPYLRPVFSQDGPSCGQAAMIGYNFTYEMCCARGLSAEDIQNQYPTHFAFNFMNGGNGWYGVSYFHSIEMLKSTGCMTVEEYGGMHDDSRRWIDGYDVYYSAMLNRVKNFYSIHTGTEDGILSLKHWLYDHMGESDFGGVASYYANVPWNAQILNDTTPEGGKHVMTAWYPAATHAMTIVGYNDSIRWDYNGDGLYTNDLDLNGDGIIDPRDWEIGAVKFVNSHGIDAQDSGFCYMMYKCLAETFENGGVWNRAVHILYPLAQHAPLMTYKVTLKHDYREKIKVLAGISADTSDFIPQWVMDFPIINYQGGNHYMQGQDTAEYLKYLEFGLDVTPLLTHVIPGNPAKFFLIVDEHDPHFEGTGEITAFSLVDYTNGTQEIISPETPLNLLNNNRTVASLVHSPYFEKVAVVTEELPPFSAGEPYGFQLEATGGSPPYDWSLRHYYRMEQSVSPFPQIDAHQVLPATAGDTLVPVALGFEFPFFGQRYDTVYLHIDGHLQFDRKQLPWPYLLDYDLHLRSNRIITPMTHENFTISPTDGDGAWYETGDTSTIFRWKLSWSRKPSSTELNLAIRLCHDGRIELIYGPSTLADIQWIGGFSAGNQLDYYESPLNGHKAITPGHVVSYLPSFFPQGLEISDNGWLSGNLADDGRICDLSVRVTDQSRISDVKPLQLSSGPLIFFTVNSPQGDGMIYYGDTVLLDLEIRNNGADTLRGMVLDISGDDAFISLQDSSLVLGDLSPGQVMAVNGAFSFIVSLEVPDQHDLYLSVILQTADKNWYKELLFKALAPDLRIREVLVEDAENGILDPGETANLLITLQNMGHADISGVSGHLHSMNPELVVTGNPVQVYGSFPKGANITRSYTVFAEESTPSGFPAHLVFNTQSSPGLTTSDTLEIRIGRVPVMLIDMDPKFHSGPAIQNMLNGLGIIHSYNTYIPGDIDKYQSLFISLGYHNSNHVLTWQEGAILADYLDNGGRIYMEGKKTWKDDPHTPVHDKFNITYAGSVAMFDTLVGIDTAFAYGIKLLNHSVYPFSFYHLVPVSPAFAVLSDNILHKTCAVAYDAGPYKTIGTLFELGTLGDLPPSSASGLLQRYLDFFDIYVNMTQVDEKPWQNSQAAIIVYPNPAVSQLTVGSSQFADGDPQPASLIIYDLLGRMVKSVTNIPGLPFQLNITTLQPGVYHVKVKLENGQSASAKFLKVTR